jgi:hypothetical protein
MKITSIEPPLAGGDLWSGTASDASKRYQWFADMAGSHFSIMEEDRPGVRNVDLHEAAAKGDEENNHLSASSSSKLRLPQHLARHARRVF